VLATGSVLTSSLLKLFQKPKDFKDRAQKSLFLTGEFDLEDANAKYDQDTLQNITWEFYLLVGDGVAGVELTANPDNQEALRDLVDDKGGICNLTFDSDLTANTSEALARKLYNELQNDCSFSVCENLDGNECKQDNTTGDFYGCDCQIVVGVDSSKGDDRAFIASVAYTDDNKTDSQDVQIIGFMQSLDITQGAGNVFGFPVNQPASPPLIPRFRNSQDFADKITEAIRASQDVVDVNSTFTEAHDLSSVALPIETHHSLSLLSFLPDEPLSSFCISYLSVCRRRWRRPC
jgi:hypothetical protein